MKEFFKHLYMARPFIWPGFQRLQYINSFLLKTIYHKYLSIIFVFINKLALNDLRNLRLVLFEIFLLRRFLIGYISFRLLNFSADIILIKDTRCISAVGCCKEINS